MSRIGALSVGEEEGVVGDQLHGVVGEIEWGDKTDVAALDVEISTV